MMLIFEIVFGWCTYQFVPSADDQFLFPFFRRFHFFVVTLNETITISGKQRVSVAELRLMCVELSSVPGNEKWLERKNARVNDAALSTSSTYL